MKKVGGESGLKGWLGGIRFGGQDTCSGCFQGLQRRVGRGKKKEIPNFQEQLLQKGHGQVKASQARPCDCCSAPGLRFALGAWSNLPSKMSRGPAANRAAMPKRQKKEKTTRTSGLRREPTLRRREGRRRQFRRQARTAQSCRRRWAGATPF